MSDYGNLNKNSRRRRRRRNNAVRMVVLALLALVILGAIGCLLYFVVIKPNTGKETVPVIVLTESESGTETSEGSQSESKTIYTGDYAEILAEAERTAAMYDYDKAVEMIASAVPDYQDIPELQSFTESCLAKKSQLVKWSDNTKITHIFFHILVVEEEVAFSSQNYSATDYNQVMTTVDEFKAIIETMYEEGYVMVHLTDIAKIEEQQDGSYQMTYQPIYLPEGKIPFVLSEDDVCYYEYMLDAGSGVSGGTTASGYATKFVFDEDGNITNEVKLKDGTYMYGSYDVATIIDDFVEEHPDFSYRGAKGTLALTGYNGILGYRTSYLGYATDEVLMQHYDELFKSDYFDEATAYNLATKKDAAKPVHQYDVVDIEAERAACTEMASALKAEGWDFASHTWGHMNMNSFDNTAPVDRFYRDTQWWNVEVAPLIGGTDIIIFAFGGDLGNWKPYSADNKLYTYLKSMGFDYYCNVDASNHYWVQMKASVASEDGSYVDDGYFRMARRNLDGQRLLEDILYPEKNRLSDLFDSKAIFSKKRPLPETGGGTFIGVTIPDDFDPDVFRAQLTSDW